MPVRHAPFWLDRVPKGRRLIRPPLAGTVDTDVAIIGGGLTGCACAFAFASAGVQVVVLEADAVGQQGAARSSGIIREDFEAAFREAASAHGLAAARSMWQALRLASLDLAAVLRRMDARCELDSADLLSLAGPGAEAAHEHAREYRARRAAGLRLTWATPRAVSAEASLESAGATRTRASTLDPYRACLAIAAAAVRRGAAIHERSLVTRVRSTRRGVEVTTGRGTVRARAVVVATPSPLPDLRALRRHLKPHASYAVVTAPMPAPMRRAVGSRAAMVSQEVDPPHLLRWLPGDRILFTGADQAEPPPRARDRALVQRTGQLMYELSLLYPDVSGLPPAWSWDASVYTTPDRLPFAGVHRNFPNHLFAMRGGHRGAGFAWLAARILLRKLQGRSDKGDDLFGFARVL